jgi:hypothetical protein
MDAPNRSHYTLEPAEEHRCCEMHRLIWLRFIALGCLACAQERQKCMIELQLHKLRDREPTVTETEAALRCIGCVLDTMTCEMHNVCCLHDSSRVGNGGKACLLVTNTNIVLLCHGSNIANLHVYSGYGLKMVFLCSLL